MFARIKNSGKYQYLQLVENRRKGKQTRQRVIATIGRLDRLQEKGDIDALVHSLSKYSAKVILLLSGKGEVQSSSKTIGPSLIFDRLWTEMGIGKVINTLLNGRKFTFDVERAIYMTVLHRLFPSGSDRSCEKWRRDHRIRDGCDISLHHLYRAMAWLGEPLPRQKGATPFAPRCVKDQVEERMFFENRDLFSGLDLVFFDTTSIYFEGAGGESLGQKGFSKDHRPDLNQMVVGAVLDDHGRPICCEMWPGNTADVKTLIPVTDRLRSRFQVGRFCVVADRGMISEKTMKDLEDPGRKISYILGVRMRKVKAVRDGVISRAGRYQEVYPEGCSKKDPAPLKVKEVVLEGCRYIVCLNHKEARKDAAARQAIVDALQEKLKRGAKTLVGNKGYRKYLKVERGSVSLDMDKVKAEERFDGKWVLKTNTDLSAEEVALKYKQLGEVEQAFRDIKTILDSRPIFHKRDQTIRGHVFCSFLALVLRKELFRRLAREGHCFEWADIKQDLMALQETLIEDQGKSLALRSECLGTCGKVFQAVGVAIPPTIREAGSC